jgi:hypothetical protein
MSYSSRLTPVPGVRDNEFVIRADRKTVFEDSFT